MIGRRLSDLRQDADLTQDDLAAALKINKHSISAYERDRNEAPDDIKIAIAKYFGVSVDYLLGLTDDPRPYGTAHHTVLRLPSDFPKEARQSLIDYAMYLKTRYGSDAGGRA